jgi:hypothetical protein
LHGAHPIQTPTARHRRELQHLRWNEGGLLGQPGFSQGIKEVFLIRPTLKRGEARSSVAGFR